MIGRTIGSYQVVAKLGEGGMGEVYRAHDAKLNRDVALKVLPASLEADPDRLARFEREAKALAALNHPNIAQIFQMESVGGAHALVMELVEGPTLAERIAAGPMPLDEALPIARQVADALEAAHERGIIHRDLKPANIKVRDDGTVKVLDFGLAKAFDPATGSSPDVMNSPTLTARATQLGTILGTAAYMAPEQAKGKAVDRRADIWAFGVVLFEMLAGQRAFKGDDVSDVIAAVLRQEIDWKALPAATPPKIRAVLERCLERDPKKRLRDIGDVWFGIDVTDDVVAAPAAAVTPAPVLSRLLPWLAAAVLAGGSIAWAMLRTPDREPAHVTRTTTFSKDFQVFINVARDGRSLAYSVVTGQNDSVGIVLRRLDQFDGKVIPGTENGGYPVFSPDGNSIAFVDLTGQAIKKIPITGGTATKLCDGNLQPGAAWSEDNTLVFVGPKGLMRVSGDGGVPEPFTTVDSAKGEVSHSRPQFLPGGKQVLFTVASSSGLQFAVRDLSRPGHRILANGGWNGQYVRSGHLTFLRNGSLFAVPFDVSRLETTGGEVPVVENVSTVGPTGTADYSVSDGGLLAYFLSQEAQGTTLAWADRTGGTKPLTGQSKQAWGTGRLSPDGRLVANGITDAKGVRDIWTYDTERGALQRLTFGAQGDSADYPVWSANSRMVFFRGRSGGKTGLYSVPADASAKATLLLTTETPATPSSVTPDGKTLLYFQATSENRSQILRIDIPANGAAATPVPLHESTGAESLAQVNPSGRWVAYVSNESGSGEVYVLPYPGPGPKTLVSLEGGTAPRWSKDGKELLYWASQPTARLMSVDVVTAPTFKAGQPRELFKQLSTTTWDVSPDRNRFLVELSSRNGGTTLAIVTNWFEELRQRAPAKK